MKVAACIVVAVALFVGCGGAKSPRSKAPEMHTWIPADAPYAFAMLEPIDLEALIKLYGQFAGYFWDQFRGEIGDDMAAKIAAEFSGKGNAAGLESLGFAPRMYMAMYGDGKAHVGRMDVKDGAAVLALVTRIAQRFGETLPAPVVKGDWRLWETKIGEDTLVVTLGPSQLVIAYGPQADITRVMPTLIGTTKPTRSLADTGELFALRDSHHKDAQAIGVADTARLLGMYAREGTMPDCAKAISAFAKRMPRAVMGFGLFDDRHEMSIAVDVAPDLVEELRALRVPLPPLAAASPAVAPAQRPLASMAIGADIEKGRVVMSAGMNAVKRVAEACHAPKHIEGADEVIQLLKQPIPPPFDGLRGGVMVANNVVYPRGAAIPTELDGYVMVTGTDLTELFRMAKDTLRTVTQVNFSLDGKLHPVPLTGLPITLPFELAAGGTPKGLVMAFGKKGTTDGQKALTAAAVPSPLFFAEGDYARLAQIRLERGESEEDEPATDTTGSSAPANDKAGGAEMIRDTIAAELYTRALVTLDVDARSVRMFMRYDRRQP